MPRGAAPGERRGGRAKGTPNARSLVVAAEAKERIQISLKENVTPLEVLLEQMHWYRDRADALQELLDNSKELLTPQAVAAGGEAVLQVLKLINKMVNFRQLAQSCAADAAPYCHAKLASVEFKDTTRKPVDAIGKLMSPKDAARRYQETLEGVAVPR